MTLWRRRVAALMLTAAAWVAFPACESDEAAEKDAKDAGNQVEDEAGEAKKDVDKEIKD